MLEQLKDENAMVRTLRDEIRNLKDEKEKMDEKLKMVRPGGMNTKEGSGGGGPPRPARRAPPEVQEC
jgi:hypothetical protein